MWHHATYHAYRAHAVSNAGMGWFGHTVISSLIHGLVYGAIFHLFRGMSLGMVVLIAMAGISIIGVFYWLSTRGD